MKDFPRVVNNKDPHSKALSLFENALYDFELKKYKDAYLKIKESYGLFFSIKDNEYISVCLSFIGLLKYLSEDNAYYKSVLILEDAKFLASNMDEGIAFVANKFAFAHIFLCEGNYSEALLYLDKISFNFKDFTYIKIKICEILSLCHFKMKNFEKAYAFLNNAIEQVKSSNLEFCLDGLTVMAADFQNESVISTLETENSFDTNEIISLSNDPMLAMLKIARTMSGAIDIDTLLETITEQTKLVLNADRCSVFLIDREKNELWSRVASGMESQEIRFPIDTGLAGHVATTGETIYIKDAYNDARFNKDIDNKTGYVTKNILCMPIRNVKYEIIGVFEVLNKRSGDFTGKDEDLLLTIGSSAGIALENNILINRQQKMLDEQNVLFSNFIDALAASIDAKDKITSGHSTRVKSYAEIISRELNLNEQLLENISKAAMLHDIGKIGIRDSVLQKEGRLSEDEYEHIKSHVDFTYSILSKISVSKQFDEVVEIASSHHEKYDGSGYFRHLAGEDIPLGGRILAVADVFDAITSVRHYRDKMPVGEAISILVNGQGTHFDKLIVDAFLNVTSDKIIDIFLTEYNEVLNVEHRNLLQEYKMIDLYNLLNGENKTDSECRFIELFESYYINKSVVRY